MITIVTENDRVIRAVLVSRFGAERTRDVIVEDDIDADGDPILHVSVIYRSEMGRLDRREMIGIVRRLRPALAQVREERFPLISFISDTDAVALSGAA